MGKAKATNHKNVALLPSIDERPYYVTKTTVTVEKIEAHSPNLIVPSIAKGPSKSKCTLQDFGSVPYFVRLPCRMLRQHSL